LREETHDAVDFRQTDDAVPGNVGNLGDTVDSDKVVLAGAGQVDVADLDHFIGAHLVIDQGQFREMPVVEARENLAHIHLGDPVRGFRQAVVRQVQPQRFDDAGHQFPDTLVFLLFAETGFDHRGFEPVLDQGIAHQDGFRAQFPGLGNGVRFEIDGVNAHDTASRRRG
jgi:hypothetical protein